VNPLFSAALEVQDFCESRNWEFCFIGGLAVLRWGEPRLTHDVDLTLLSGYGSEEPFIDALVGAFRGRLDDTAGFARRHRVLLLKAANGTPVDVALGALAFEQRAVARSSPFDVGEDRSLRTCSAEDLVVHKAFAARDRDWLDIEGIVARQRGSLDSSLIWDEVRPLLALKDDHESEGRLNAMLSRE
jgi:hypothetical protein